MKMLAWLDRFSSGYHDLMYGRDAHGHSYWAGGLRQTSNEELSALCQDIADQKERMMKAKYDFSQPYPLPATKACHACGQRLPLKAGEFVEFITNLGQARVQQGIVTKVYSEGRAVSILGLDGREYARERAFVTRLHGYYRVTEREVMR